MLYFCNIHFMIKFTNKLFVTVVLEKKLKIPRMKIDIMQTLDRHKMINEGTTTGLPHVAINYVCVVHLAAIAQTHISQI